MQTSEPLRQFLQAARSAGIRVSAAEGIDAARAVQVVGFTDRTALKDTLGSLSATPWIFTGQPLRSEPVAISTACR